MRAAGRWARVAMLSWVLAGGLAWASAPPTPAAVAPHAPSVVAQPLEGQKVELSVRARGMREAPGHQMRVITSSGLDTGWMAYSQMLSLRIPGRGRVWITVNLRNPAGAAAASTFIIRPGHAHRPRAPAMVAATGPVPPHPPARPPVVRNAGPAPVVGAHPAGAAPEEGGVFSRWLGRAGGEIAVGPAMVNHELALKISGALVAGEFSANAGVRLEAEKVLASGPGAFTRMGLTLGKRFGSGGDIRLSLGWLSSYTEGRFPDLGTKGGDVVQYSLGLGWRSGAGRSGRGMRWVARGVMAVCEDLKLGDTEVVRPDAYVYRLEYGFGGGKMYRVEAGVSLGGKKVSIVPTLGLTHRTYNSFLGNPSLTTTSPSAGLAVDIKGVGGGRAGVVGRIDDRCAV